MTELRTRLRMAWAVLRGRSVMYRWHSTSTGMIPKTLGAMAVENTGQPEITTEQVEGTGSERPEPAVERSPLPVLDVRGDAADKPSPRLPTDPAMPQPQGSRPEPTASEPAVVAETPSARGDAYGPAAD